MDKGSKGWTLGELATLLGGDLHGPADLFIKGPVSADSDSPDGIAFCESPEYLAQSTGVGALVLPRDLDTDKPHIKVDQPRRAFGLLLALADTPMPLVAGIHRTAIVHAGAQIDPTASVGPYAVIEDEVVVGPRTRIYPFSYIGHRCEIGADVTVYPHAVLYKDITVGDRTIIHSGVVLGADGFGFLWDGKRRIKVPQAGGVTLGNDVEIGANTAIDRATTGETRLGNGTKIDNLVQIGHNCTVGNDTVIAALTGISGSSHIGNRCIFGGQSALSDHVTIGDDITFGGRTGTSKSLSEPGIYFGAPALPIAEGMRVYTLNSKLPELFKRVKELERQLAKLEKKA